MSARRTATAPRPRVVPAEPRFRERERAHRRRPWRRVLWVVGLLAVAAAVAWALWWSPVFVVRSVEVTGVGQADQKSIAAMVDAEVGTPLARVDLAAVERQVRSRRDVAEVAVSRSWPGTLTVTAVLRKPALVLKDPQGQLQVVDASGVAYATVRTPPAGVPVVTASSARGTTEGALNAALTMVSALPDDLATQVRAIEVSSANLVTFTLGSVRVVWGGPDQPERKVEIVRALIPTKAKVIDVSAPETPVTR